MKCKLVSVVIADWSEMLLLAFVQDLQIIQHLQLAMV